MNKLELSSKFGGRRYKDIEVCGQKLRLQSLNSREKTAWDCSRLDDAGNFSAERAELARERLICSCLVDENGTRLFPEKTDVGIVCEWGDDVVTRIFDECQAHIQSVSESIVKN